MKLIEALKQIKDLSRKHDDIVAKIRTHAAISSIETKVYPDQQARVTEWLQSQSDILKEILRLRLAIQATNLATMVEIELGGFAVNQSIAAWIHRRRDLANEEREAWEALTDCNIKEGTAQGPSGAEILIKIVRFYDPARRDAMRERFRAEPSKIDATLEVVNAVTDLIGDIASDAEAGPRKTLSPYERSISKD